MRKDKVLAECKRAYDLCQLLGITIAVSESIDKTDIKLIVGPIGKSPLDLVLIQPGGYVKFYESAKDLKEMADKLYMSEAR